MRRNHARPKAEDQKHFGMTVPSHIVDAWTTDSKHPIALVGMLPVLICKEVLASNLRDRAVIFFIDNNASLFQVKMQAPSAMAPAMAI